MGIIFGKKSKFTQNDSTVVNMLSSELILSITMKEFCVVLTKIQTSLTPSTYNKSNSMKNN